MTLGPKIRVPWEHPRTPAENDENWRWLTRLFDQDKGDGSRWATVVIAPSDATKASIEGADFVCTGTGDQAVIQSAITDLETRTSTLAVGRVVLLEGTFHFSDSVTINALAGRVISIVGMGAGLGHSGSLGGTVIDNGTSSDPAFDLGGSGSGSAVQFRDLHIKTGAHGGIRARDLSVSVANCNFTGASIAIDMSSSTGGGAGSFFANNVISLTGGSGIIADVGASLDKPIFIIGNSITTAGSSTGIDCTNSLSTLPSYVIANNYVNGAAVGINVRGNSAETCPISGNYLISCPIGIQVAGYRHVVSGNVVNDATTAAYTTVSGFDGQHIAFLGNGAHDSGIGFRVAAGSQRCTVIGNKGSGLTTAYTVGSGATDSFICYNDFSGVAGTDSGTNTVTTGTDIATALGSGTDLDANARVGIRRNSTGTTSKRRRINFIEGSNVTITVADDSSDEEVDVTVAAAGGGSGTTTIKKNGSSVGSQSTLNLIEGTGISLTVTDTGTEIDITIDATSGSRSPDVDSDWFALWGSMVEQYEFNASPTTSLPSGWSWVNQNSSTYQEGVGAGILKPDNSGTDSLKGIFRSLPAASNFAMKLGMDAHATNGICMGLSLRESSTGKQMVFTNSQGTNGWIVDLYSNPTTWSSRPGAATASFPQGSSWGDFYLMVHKNSSTSYDFYVSSDGVTFFKRFSGINPGFTPDQVGIVANSRSASDCQMSCHWYRAW